MAGLNTVSNLPPAVQAYYDKRALLRAKNILTAYELCQKKELPENNSATAYFWRYAPLNIVTAALSEAVDGGITLASRQNLTSQEVSATVAMWGDFISLGRLAELTTIDKGVSEKVDVLAQQAAESIDYSILKQAAGGMLRRRADSNNSYQLIGTATGGTTGTLVDTVNITQATNYWAGGYVTITGGPGYGQSSIISGSSGNTLTLTTALSTAPTTSTTYRVVVGTGIDASAKLDSTIARLANRDLKKQKALHYEQGFYVGVLDPDVEYDFFGDATFQKAATYKDSVDNLITNEIGKWAGVRWVSSTVNYRETVAGVESTSGAVHVIPILGKEALGVVNLGGMGGAKKNFQIKVKSPEQLGQALDFYSTVGWQAFFTSIVLNGCFGVNILTGASDTL